MPFVRITVTLSVLTLLCTPAWAQLGLYGSPAPLDYQQMYAAPSPYSQPYAPQVGPYAARYPAQTMSYAPAGQLPSEPAPPMAPGVDPVPGASPSDRPAVVDRMLDEAASGRGPATSCYAPASCGASAVCGGGCGEMPGCGEVGPACGPLTGMMNSFEQAFMHGGDCCGDPGGYPWFASASTLVLGRNEPNKLWTTYSGVFAEQLYHTNDIPLEWEWGGEIRFGRKFCRDCCTGCYRYGLETVYWSTQPFSGQLVAPGAPRVSTTLTVGHVEFAGSSAALWYDQALEHRLSRHNEFHNLELNLIRYKMCAEADTVWDAYWTLGFRYFSFDEHLIFSTLADPNRIPDPNVDEAFIDESIENDLYGVQFGFHADHYLLSSLMLFVDTKVGLFNNHIDQLFQMYLEDGTVADVGGSGVVGTYPVHSSENVLSFLTQIDVGGEWQVSERLSARLGYRVVFMTGMGLADNQIPHFVVDVPEIADIEHNGDLILHGAFAGATFKF
jgi:hypothetical protein